MKIFVLQYRLRMTFECDTSVVIGAYSSYDEMRKAAKEWCKDELHSVSSSLFYDIKQLDGTADWTNDQMSFLGGLE